jgi:hypothetical protein
MDINFNSLCIDDKIIPHHIVQSIIVFPDNQCKYVKSCWCHFYKVLNGEQHNMIYVYVKNDIHICYNSKIPGPTNNFLMNLSHSHKNPFTDKFHINGPGIVYSLERDLTLNDIQN